MGCWTRILTQQVFVPQLLDHLAGLFGRLDLDLVRLTFFSGPTTLNLAVQLFLPLVVVAHIGRLDTERILAVHVVPKRAQLARLVDFNSVIGNFLLG